MFDRPLKVLTVTSIYPQPARPALGAFVASQVESLRAAGIEVDVCFLDAIRSKWELVRGVKRVRRAVSSGTYDLVHAHFGYNGVPASLQSVLPIVVSYCGTDLIDPRLRAISRWVAGRADASIVKSDSLGALLGRPAFVIPNGVDLTRFRPGVRTAARRRLGLDPRHRYVLFVSTDLARSEKRYPLALAAVVRAGYELLPLSNRPHADAPVYYQAADALILTSLYEGSPNAIKEAMASNLPIVNTDVGDVRQRIDGLHNCRVSAPTIDALSNGLRTVLEDGLPSNGRTRMDDLSAESIARRVADVYQQVVQRSHSA